MFEADVLQLLDVYVEQCRPTAIDLTFDTLDTYLMEGRFQEADRYMVSMAVLGFSDAFLLSALVVSKPWRDHVQEGRSFVSGVLESRA